MVKKKSKPKTGKREYNSKQVETVHNLKNEFGWSVRKISKETGIPKSVVGRWTKEPMVWRRKYDFTRVRRKTPGMTKKKYEEFRKIEKQILKAPLGRQSELTIHYIDDDDEFVLESM